MNDNSDAIVKAVQESIANLQELVVHATRERDSRQVQAMREDAQTTALMMIAAIVWADKKYSAGEQAFLKQLVDWSQQPGGELKYLNEYAESWTKASTIVPGFFQAAAGHGMKLARAMIVELQLIGNNTCVSDGHFEAIEHPVVRDYVSLLENYLTPCQEGPAVPTSNDVAGWKSV